MMMIIGNLNLLIFPLLAIANNHLCKKKSKSCPGIFFYFSSLTNDSRIFFSFFSHSHMIIFSFFFTKFFFIIEQPKCAIIGNEN